MCTRVYVLVIWKLRLGGIHWFLAHNHQLQTQISVWNFTCVSNIGLGHNMPDTWWGMSTGEAGSREEPDVTFKPWLGQERYIERERVRWGWSLSSSSQEWLVTSPSLLFLWRRLIPTCTQRLGSAEWPKWKQSSWPRQLRPAEWSSLCSPWSQRGEQNWVVF